MYYNIICYMYYIHYVMLYYVIVIVQVPANR